MIEVTQAKMKFDEFLVFEDVSINFLPGTITGIVGRNGSGKTVLFKSILGLIPLTQGQITIDGKQIGVDIDIARNIGAIIETPGFLDYLSGFDNLSQLAGIRRLITQQHIDKALEIVGLKGREKDKVRHYSMGMRQRLGIAQAIMEDPDYLILDEPFNGLDSQGVSEMRQLLLDLKARGKGIILASHSDDDIGILCDHVYRFTDHHLNQEK